MGKGFGNVIANSRFLFSIMLFFLACLIFLKNSSNNTQADDAQDVD